VLLLIPLGAGEERPRTPPLTLAIIVLNLALFGWSSRYDTAKASSKAEELSQIAEWSLDLARKEHRELDRRLAQSSSALAFLDRDPYWEREISSQELRERLTLCLADYRALKKRHPFYSWGLVPGELRVATLITYQFLHVDFLHLLLNMLFLWVVGCTLELALGRAAYLTAYLAGGVVAALAHTLSNPASYDPAIGSSGAVAGLMGVFTVLFAREPIRIALIAAIAIAPRVSFFSLPAWVFFALWLIEQLFYFSLRNASLNVAFMAHIGGFVFGALAGLAYWAWRRRE
jgi:membrane associated rhomboid family serine protease